MDNAFSHLIPEYRIGRDGFDWWIGQVEQSSREVPEVKGANRYKVRIVGEHLKDCEVVPTSDLPWASVMMPVTVPFNVGNKTGAHSQLKKGSWVIGFYLDPEKQKPIIMGSIGMTPGATKIVEEYQPGKCNSFTTFLDPDINVAKDGLPAPANPKSKSSSQTKEESSKREPKKSETGIQTGSTMFDPNLAAAFNTDIDLGLNIDYNQVFGNSSGTFATFSTNAFGAEALQTSTELAWGCPKPHDPPIPSSQIAPLSEGSQVSEDWCQQKAKKCGPEDLKTSATRIMGEFLAEVQRNNGNIGTYLVSQSTGGIYDATYTARKYTNKLIKVIKFFLAKLKGYISEKLQEGVEKLIKAVLRPDGTGNVLTPVTKWFNKNLKDLGCKMEDIGERLIKWITNLLMGYVSEIYQNVACLIDSMVNGILAQLTSLLEEVIESILGPLEEILGPVASALNMVGGAIAQVLKFLGITCSGPEAKCSEEDSECTNGEQKKKEKDFLDQLLEDIDKNIFPDTAADYNQYTCDEAYEGGVLTTTSVGFRGGVFNDKYGESASNNPNSSTYKKKIVYSIADIEVLEGDDAVFTVTRTGYTEVASSVLFNTIGGYTATEGKDFISLDDIVGFAAGETTKTVSVKTLKDFNDDEDDEIFYVKIKSNSPSDKNIVTVSFEKNVATCTIKQKVKDDSTNYDPYDTFTVPSDVIVSELSDTINEAVGDPVDEEFVEDDTKQYKVVANPKTVKAGDFIIYTVTTKNVKNGTILTYVLSNNFSPSEIVGGITQQNFVVNNNTAKLTVGIEDSYESDVEKSLNLSIAGTTASAEVLVLSNQTVADIDIGVGDSVANVYTPPTIPVVNTEDIITDDSGTIIEIPVSTPGGPYAEPPFVTIGGNGIGAAATALLDDEGFVTEIRVLSGGYGYKKNLPEEKGVRCIIDTFTLLRPGLGYSTAPTIFINDDPTIAEAIINDDGFVIGGRVLNREVTFNQIPKVVIIGGGGYGAKLMPSLACLPESRLVELGATKIGTGRYVDCP